jgi:hypothetical protein
MIHRLQQVIGAQMQSQPLATDPRRILGPGYNRAAAGSKNCQNM